MTDRLALITGAAQGIGFALARGLGQAGASLVLNDINEPRLERAVGELMREGLAVDSQVFDVRDASQVEAGVAAVEEMVGPIEILVNNAGIQYREPLEAVSLGSWRDVVDTNLTGVFLVAQAVARGMSRRGHGKIINITSVFSEYSRPTIASYAATKAGVKNLTKAMCVEWARHGIQANAIGPGYFVTPLTQSLRDNETFDAWLRSRVPAGRWGELDELVGTAVFLASPASDFVNGQTIHVDGGLLSVI